ncbi:MAG: hypothetical protein ACXVAY_00890 [Mucilaginibacter sp.]
MKKIKHFRSAVELVDLINGYFASIGIQAMFTVVRGRKPKIKTQKQTQHIRQAKMIAGNDSKTVDERHDPPTLSGLALFLGFESIRDLEAYESQGLYKLHIKRARLLINAAYEKKLFNSNPSGAIFALKGMGRKIETPATPANEKIRDTLKVEIIQTGPKTADSEKNVRM